MLRLATPEIHIIQPVNPIYLKNRHGTRFASYLWKAFEEQMPRDSAILCFLLIDVDVVGGG